MKNKAEEIANILLDIRAVNFVFQKPVILKSGIVSPVYVDNRILPFYPDKWKQVIEAFSSVLDENNVSYDAIAGMESGGVPHSAALGFYLQKPSIFVRKEAKDHGMKKMIEGGDVSGKRLLLVEDLVTTGSSSLKGIEELRNAGADVSHCIAIVSYGFPDTVREYTNKGVTLHTLTTLPIIFHEAVQQGIISDSEVEILNRFLSK